jgi:hypothetical protein
MISYVMANFPKDYSKVVAVIDSNGMAGKMINDLRLAVRDNGKG